MSLSDQDRAAIKRVAALLTGDHFGSNAKAIILEAQMIEVAERHIRSGNGALGSWIASAGSLARLLLVFVDEQKEVRRQLKI